MVRTFLGMLVALLFASLSLTFAIGQEPPPPKPPAEDVQPSMYSGTVVEMTTDKVTVSRTILSNPEKRTFQLNADTKVEGKLKAKSRVTVRFTATDDGYLAVSILVRDRADGKKK